MADSQLLHFLQLLFPLADGEKRALYLPVQDFTGFGELHAPAGTQKQRSIQVLLQPGNRLADGRLADIKRPGRSGDIFASRNSDKNMIKVQILLHGFLLLFITCIHYI